MDIEFQKKIKQEIEHSGFPLEIDLTSQLRNKGHLVFSNLTFSDDQNQVKELDILSLIFDKKKEKESRFAAIQLLVECKKTSKYPWVFFEEVYNPLNAMGMVHQADYLTDHQENETPFNILVSCAHTQLNKHHYNSFSIPKTRVYFEAFKSSNESTTIYRAVNNIFAGRKYMCDWFKTSVNPSKSTGKRAFLNQFAIVVDGPLILASKSKKNFEIKEANMLSLLAYDTLQKSSKKLLGNEIIIDVIKRESFADYIKITERNATYLDSHLTKIGI